MAGLIWPLVFFIIVAFLASAAMFRQQREQRRQETLQAIANEWGYDFVAEARELPERETGFYFLSQSSSHRTQNIISNTNGHLSVSLFDHSYKANNDDIEGSYDRFQTIVRFHSPLLQLPFVSIRPKSIRNRFQNSPIIRYVNDPLFNANYLVFAASSAPIEPAKDRVTTDIRAWLLKHDSRWTVEAEGSYLYAYCDLLLVDGRGLKAFADEAREIFDLFVSGTASEDGWVRADGW